jgi:hypothetical protein
MAGKKTFDPWQVLEKDRSRSLLKRILFEEAGQPTRTGSGSDQSLRREG